MRNKDRRRRLFFTSVIFFLAITASVSQATILTFGDLGLGNFDPIPQTYGDNVTMLNDGVGSYLEGNGFTPNISTQYRAARRNNHLTFEPWAEYWDTSYGDLIDIAISGENGALVEIVLVPEPGWAVRLNSFDVAAWETNIAGQMIRILDDGFGTLVDYTPIDIPGAGHLTLNPDLIHAGPVRIQLGPNWNSGIDNINFDQVSLAQGSVATVPEPGSSALFILGGVGLLLYRLRAACVRFSKVRWLRGATF